MSGRLPPGVESAWAMHAGRAKARPQLSPGRVVAAGVAVADQDGLAAVAMKRVAAELGATTMALYRHVSSKDELLALMGDAVFSSSPEPRRPDEDWRTALTRWAHAHMAILRAHPWVLELPIAGPPQMPHQLAWLDAALAPFEGTSLSGVQRLSSAMLVNGFVRTMATQEAAVVVAARAQGIDVGQFMTDYFEQLTSLAERAELRHLRAAITAATPKERHDEFEFGLERILDGVGLLMRSC